jgi:MFS family permease
VQRPRGVRRDLRLSIGDGAGYGLMAGMAEVYLPAFALALGMPPALAGLLATTPLLAAGLLQLLAPRAIVRQRSLRRWIAVCVAVQALAFVPLIAIAIVGTASTTIIFASASLYWAAGMGASAGWNPWMARVVPSRIRGRFFGRRQGLVQATMLAGLIGAGSALHVAKGSEHVLHVFAAMFAIACVARLGSALALARMGQGIDVAPRKRVRLRSMPERLRDTPRGSLLAYVITASSAAAISGAFVTPYLLDLHRFDYVPYAVFTATIVLAKIAFSPMLGRHMQRVGVRRVVSACAIAIASIPLMYVVYDGYWWLLFIQFYGGIAWGGFELGVLMVLFDAEDDGERTTMQVAYSGLNAIGNAGGAFIGGALLASMGSDYNAYVWVFIVSAAARTCAALLIVKNLPLVLARLPATVVVGAWTLAIRPWGGTIVRPIVEGISRLRR